MCAERHVMPWVKVLSLACGAVLLSTGAGCGGGAAAGGALSAAVDERRQEVERGDATGGTADLLFALLAAGLDAGGDEASGSAGASSALTEDPHDHSAAGDVVDEPLAPKAAATDKRDLSCGTSPDPAPEMPTGDSGSAECADGYAEFRGECLPQQVVEGLIALGVDPGDNPGT